MGRWDHDVTSCPVDRHSEASAGRRKTLNSSFFPPLIRSSAPFPGPDAHHSLGWLSHLCFWLSLLYETQIPLPFNPSTRTPEQRLLTTPHPALPHSAPFTPDLVLGVFFPSLKQSAQGPPLSQRLAHKQPLSLLTCKARSSFGKLLTTAYPRTSVTNRQ